jgi:acyl-CoA reductase-like NAD-dependent aldehyde dehydrogenase
VALGSSLYVVSRGVGNMLDALQREPWRATSSVRRGRIWRGLKDLFRDDSASLKREIMLEDRAENPSQQTAKHDVDLCADNFESPWEGVCQENQEPGRPKSRDQAPPDTQRSDERLGSKLT